MTVSTRRSAFDKLKPGDVASDEELETQQVAKRMDGHRMIKDRKSENGNVESELEYFEDEHYEEEPSQESNPQSPSSTIQQYIDRIHYSQRYSDDTNEYRHVILPREYYHNYVPDEMKGRLLTEAEWRSLGIQQSLGWVHYELHRPEPHIFLFKRDK